MKSKEVLKIAKIFFYGRNMIINALENDIFPLAEEEMPQHEEWTEEEKGEEYIPPKEVSEIIAEEEKGINNDLFRYYFKYQNPRHMYKNLDSTKNIERNKIHVDLIKSALTDLKNKNRKMSKNEKRIEQPDKMVDTVEKILEFNNQNQEGQRLKILTPNAW